MVGRNALNNAVVSMTASARRSRSLHQSVYYIAPSNPLSITCDRKSISVKEVDWRIEPRSIARNFVFSATAINYENDNGGSEL